MRLLFYPSVQSTVNIRVSLQNLKKHNQRKCIDQFINNYKFIT